MSRRRRPPSQSDHPVFRAVCTDRGQHPETLLQILLVEKTELSQAEADRLDTLIPDTTPDPGNSRPAVGVTYTVHRTTRSRRRPEIADTRVGPDHLGARTWRFPCTHPGCRRDPRFTEQRLGRACDQRRQGNPGLPKYTLDVSYAD